MRSVLSSLCLAATLLASLPSSGQTDPAKAEALKRYNEGIALHDGGKEQEAYLKFAQAYAVLKTPPILFNLARTEQLTLRLVEASAHFREYVALPDQPLISKQAREKARGFLAELHAQLGHVALTAPAGSTIAIDGVDLSQRAPIADEIDVLAGNHVIVARLDDKSATAKMAVAPGVATPVSLQFEQRADPTPAPQPSAAPAPPASAAAASPERPPPVGDDSHAARDVVRWTSTGVAIVGIGIGIGFAIAAGSKDSDLVAYQLAHPQACTNGSGSACADASALQDDRDHARTFATVGFVVGGIGAAVAVASWLFWPNTSASAQRGTWIAPSFGVAGYGLQGGARF